MNNVTSIKYKAYSQVSDFYLLRMFNIANVTLR